MGEKMSLIPNGDVALADHFGDVTKMVEIGFTSKFTREAGAEQLYEDIVRLRLTKMLHTDMTGAVFDPVCTGMSVVKHGLATQVMGGRDAS